ncbi:hypothetical protein Lalb_Chr20g0112461 [Lupinus albus]|uniref:Uncharacterized protein n=1 Tax=Lupinus albus TaxID=3870 RepID=A0A6A4NW55_LUPAL|nr:hypothetical protein Lalb_Chr20g0112461 [Lupinus albus]
MSIQSSLTSSCVRVPNPYASISITSSYLQSVHNFRDPAARATRRFSRALERGGACRSCRK